MVLGYPRDGAFGPLGLRHGPALIFQAHATVVSLLHHLGWFELFLDVLDRRVYVYPVAAGEVVQCDVRELGPRMERQVTFGYHHHSADTLRLKLLEVFPYDGRPGQSHGLEADLAEEIEVVQQGCIATVQV